MMRARSSTRRRAWSAACSTSSPPGRCSAAAAIVRKLQPTYSELARVLRAQSVARTDITISSTHSPSQSSVVAERPSTTKPAFS